MKKCLSEHTRRPGKMEARWQGSTSLQKAGYAAEFVVLIDFLLLRRRICENLPLVLSNSKVLIIRSVKYGQTPQREFNSKLFLHSVVCQVPLGMKAVLLVTRR